MTGRAIPGPATRLERAAWCTFDFANSSFTTIMITAVYPSMFVALAKDQHRGDVAWAWALATSATIALLLSPIVGALADQHARKKLALAITWIVCVICCAALSLAPRGGIALAWTFFALANVGFLLGENVIAAFLPELATKAELGRLSGTGWAVGYLGGLVSLAAAWQLIKAGAPDFVPLLTGAFFFVAGLPTFLVLRERARPRERTGAPLRAAFAQVRATFATRSRFPDLYRLLVALFLEQAGVVIVIGFSSLYAQSALGLTPADLAMLFIFLQLAAASGALLFGFVQDKIGGKRALLATIAIWIAAVAVSLLATTREQFYVGAALAGFAMGSCQASGRAMVGLFTPPDRQGEWFGLWGIATKAAGVLGIVAYAVTRQAGSMRTAMASTAIYFALSSVVLLTVNEARGRAAAQAGSP